MSSSSYRGSSSKGGKKDTTSARTRAKASSIAKSKLYTSNGSRIRNPEAYAAAGGRAYSSNGAPISDVNAYTSAIEASVRQNTNDPKYLYHYTDNASAQKIQESGHIRASSKGMEGKGTYMTAKPPRSSDTSLLNNNYGGSAGRENKVQSYFRFDADQVAAVNYREESGRNVWKTSGDVGVGGSHAKYGQRDTGRDGGHESHHGGYSSGNSGGYDNGNDGCGGYDGGDY